MIEGHIYLFCDTKDNILFERDCFKIKKKENDKKKNHKKQEEKKRLIKKNHEVNLDGNESESDIFDDTLIEVKGLGSLNKNEHVRSNNDMVNTMANCNTKSITVFSSFFS